MRTSVNAVRPRPVLVVPSCGLLAAFCGCLCGLLLWPQSILRATFDLQVLQDMLDMLRDQQNNSHASRLELIIVWLLVVDCCLMLCQVRGAQRATYPPSTALWAWSRGHASCHSVAPAALRCGAQRAPGISPAAGASGRAHCPPAVPPATQLLSLFGLIGRSSRDH